MIKKEKMKIQWEFYDSLSFFAAEKRHERLHA